MSQVPRVPLVPLVLCFVTACATDNPTVATIQTTGPAVLIATIEATCERCAWDVEGREAVMFRVLLDGQYSSHLPLVRTGRADYSVLVGSVDAGTHTVTLETDSANSARELRATDSATARVTSLQVTVPADPFYLALTHAPFIHERANASGRFTDVPVFMWYEQVENTKHPETREFRYSVIFTNEDGGTPADRLMATWGRTSDIENLYNVRFDEKGNVIADEIQGPEHKILSFDGKRERRHPLLSVSTDNNMVLGSGDTTIRYAPAPVRFNLREQSREEVMDANPWLYTLAAQELRRENKIVAEDTAGHGTIPDPRRFVTIEACGQLHDASLALAVNADGQWIASDRGHDYFIARDGCFRAAIPLPPDITARDITGLRVQAHHRKTKEPLKNLRGPVQLTKINKVFMLDEHDQPARSFFAWQGAIEAKPGGPPVELPFKYLELPNK